MVPSFRTSAVLGRSALPFVSAPAPSSPREQGFSGHEPAQASPSSRHDYVRRFLTRYRDALTVFGLALAVRLLFSAIMADTFNPDEFVYLALGRDIAHGAAPYRDFWFFHPPGMLVVLGLLNPLIGHWWPLARLLDVLLDSAVAALVWRIGLHLYGRRLALAAGALYAINPTALVSAVRVDQEVAVTALGMLGLVLMLTRRSHTAALMAGICLGMACWIKYPALIFLPVYALAAPRRVPACLLGWLGATVLLFSPYLGSFHSLYDQSFAWQLFDRRPADPAVRIKISVLFWLAANPLAVAALARGRKPWWLLAGFGSGAMFLVTSHAYYHYFVTAAAFGALLGPMGVALLRLPPRAIAVAVLALTAAWSASIRGVVPGGELVTAYRFSHMDPTLHLLERSAPRSAPILADHFEYAYVTEHPSVAHYFWNDRDLVGARYLEGQLTASSVVILKSSPGEDAYPAGFETFLHAHCAGLQIPDTTIWTNCMGRRARQAIPRPPEISPPCTACKVRVECPRYELCAVAQNARPSETDDSRR